MKAHRFLGLVVGLAVVASSTAGGLASDLTIPADGATGHGEADPDVLEIMAVGLARDLRAVDGIGDAARCPVEDLGIRWGPRGGVSTDVTGQVVCRGSAADVLGFEAQRVGRVWRLHPVPHGDAVEAAPAGSGLEYELPMIDLADLPNLLSVPVDPYASYEPQRLCDPTVKPGTRALAGLLLEAVPGTVHLGITRDCSIGPISEHKEGRAFDWAVAPSQRDEVEQVLARLLATDAAGNAHALARRMGVMYIIWDGRIWASYRAAEGWRSFTGPNPHEGHVHISMSRDGAAGRTTLWRAGVAAGWWELPPAWVPPPAPPIDVVNDPPPPAPPPSPPPPPATPVAAAPPHADTADPPPRPTATPSPSPPPPTPEPTEEPPAPAPDVTVEPPAPAPDVAVEPPAPAPDVAVEPPAPAADPTDEPPPPPPAPVRVLVQFEEEGVEGATTDVVRETAGAALVRRNGLVPGLQTWQVAADEAEELLAVLRERTDVLHAEVDATIEPAALSDEAWPPDTDLEANPVVAVIGAGGVPEHLGLEPSPWSNPEELPDDGVDDDGNGYVDDVEGWDFCRDTAQAISTDEPEELDEPGDAARVRVARLTVLCDDGAGLLGDALAALDYAVTAGIPVSMNPWVVVGPPSAVLDAAVEAAEAAGHVVLGPAEATRPLPVERPDPPAGELGREGPVAAM